MQQQQEEEEEEGRCRMWQKKTAKINAEFALIIITAFPTSRSMNQSINQSINQLHQNQNHSSLTHSLPFLSFLTFLPFAWLVGKEYGAK